MTVEKSRYFPAHSIAALCGSIFVFVPRAAEAQTTMTADIPAAAPPTRQAAEDRSTRPFTFRAEQAKLDDLRRRVAATRWPEKETVPDQ